MQRLPGLCRASRAAGEGKPQTCCRLREGLTLAGVASPGFVMARTDAQGPGCPEPGLGLLVGLPIAGSGQA